MENQDNIKLNVKGLKKGYMYSTPDPIDYDDLIEDERELLEEEGDAEGGQL